MTATLVLEGPLRPGIVEEVVGLDELRFYVHLLDGEVRVFAPATGLRLTDEEVIITMGQLVAGRLPRRDVYFATQTPAAPPCLL